MRRAPGVGTTRRNHDLTRAPREAGLRHACPREAIAVCLAQSEAARRGRASGSEGSVTRGVAPLTGGAVGRFIAGQDVSARAPDQTAVDRNAGRRACGGLAADLRAHGAGGRPAGHQVRIRDTRFEGYRRRFVSGRVGAANAARADATARAAGSGVSPYPATAHSTHTRATHGCGLRAAGGIEDTNIGPSRTLPFRTRAQANTRPAITIAVSRAGLGGATVNVAVPLAGLALIVDRTWNVWA